LAREEIRRWLRWRQLDTGKAKGKARTYVSESLQRGKGGTQGRGGGGAQFSSKNKKEKKKEEVTVALRRKKLFLTKGKRSPPMTSCRMGDVVRERKGGGLPVS